MLLSVAPACPGAGVQDRGIDWPVLEELELHDMDEPRITWKIIEDLDTEPE